MLSKEEIEKRVLYAKSKFGEIKHREPAEGIEILLEIINQLENENNMFKNFYINCGKEDIAEHITATQYSKIRMEGYWEGYIQKQNEAMQICKQCKYINKSRELETKNQKLIEKLEEKIEITKKQYSDNSLLNIRVDGKLDTLEEILEISKGENDE